MLLFIKVMKKFYKYFYGIAFKEIETILFRLKEVRGEGILNFVYLFGNIVLF